MALMASELHCAIKEFAFTISDQSLGLVSYRPHSGAKHTNCIANALDVQDKYGGEVRYGWYFSHRMSEKFGDYLIATHHAVWQMEDLVLVDVTPFHPETKHQPITQSSDTLFLVDDKSQPFRRENLIVPLPLRFYVIKHDPALQNYIQKLQQKEYESYNRLYGSSFS